MVVLITMTSSEVVEQVVPLCNRQLMENTLNRVVSEKWLVQQVEKGVYCRKQVVTRVVLSTKLLRLRHEDSMENHSVAGCTEIPFSVITRMVSAVCSITRGLPTRDVKESAESARVGCV
jgi:hypothetical protein